MQSEDGKGRRLNTINKYEMKKKRVQDVNNKYNLTNNDIEKNQDRVRHRGREVNSRFFFVCFLKR